MDADPRHAPLPDGAPPASLLAGEFLGVLQPLRLAANARRLRRTPATAAQTVMVFPGLGANDTSTWPLRRWLRSRGHTAAGWGLGLNRGDPEPRLPEAIAQCEQLVREHGQSIHLVGWSLGGVFAREIARDRPDLAASATTFGTPVIGGPRFSRPGRFYPVAELDRIEAAIAQRKHRPITVPVIAMYSKRDGVVNWRACIDRDTPHAINIEIFSTHLAMGLDPDVWHTIESALRSPNHEQEGPCHHE
jgi:pimeloyl-ACP methyl ester carboxylesterase